MKNKPNLDDYGITQEEWDKFTESEEIRDVKQEINPWVIVFIRIFFGLLLVGFISILARLFVYYTTNQEIPFWNNLPDAPSLIGEYIGYAIGFAIYGYFLVYKRRLKILDKEADKVLEGLSAKKIEMLNKYKNANDEYERAIEEKDMAIKALNNELASYENLLKLINEDVLYTYNTKDLKELIQELFDNYSQVDNELFDFKNNEELIKCIGIDSFITKIELEEIKSYILQSKYTSIIIYTLIDIDKKLIKNMSFVKLVEKDEINKLFENSVIEDIEECKKELNKLKNN